MSIPKKIHYVWVGPKELTPLAEKCIASWKQYMPDFEYCFWTEDNSPMDHPYVQHMYAEKKWAFVADYIRFWALEREGGIYLDTDTEVLKSLEPLCEHSTFFGKTKDGVIAAGVIGTMPHAQVIQDIKAVYDTDVHFDMTRTSPRTVTDIIENRQYPDITVYDYQYFNPCDDGEQCGDEKKEKAYTLNHWAESWVPFARLRKFARRIGVMGILKKVHGYFV